MNPRGYFYINEPGSGNESGSTDLRRRRFIPVSAVIVVLLFIIMRLIYGFRVCPVLAVGDSGELSTAAYTGGVAHPPGYPLFTILGRIFTHLGFHSPDKVFPAGMFDAAFRMNMMSLWLGVITVVVVYFIVARATKNPFAAFLSAFIFGTGLTFLSQSLVGEVYTLHSLIVSLIIYLLLLIDERPTPWRFSMLALLFGLGLSNHTSILLLGIPTIIFLIFSIFARGLRIRRSLLIAILIFFVLGLVPYIYLPIEAHKHPYLNWGNPENPVNFFKVVTRSEFRQIKESIPFTKDSLRYSGLNRAFNRWQTRFFGRWFVILGWIGLLIALVRGKRFGLFLAMSYFFMTVPYFIYFRNITRLDLFYLEVYYIPAYLVFSIFLGYFFLGAFEYLPRLIKKKNIRSLTSLTIFMLFVVLTVVFYRTHGGSFSMRDHIVGSRYSHDVLRDMPENSILITGGDEVFLYWYLQQVADFRKDIVVLESNALTLTNKWWWDSIRKMYPDLVIPENNGDNAFPLDLFISTLHSLNPERSICFTAIPPGLKIQGAGWKLVPDGLLFAYGGTDEFKTPLLFDTPLAKGLLDSPLDFAVTDLDPYEDELVERYAFAFFNYGNYYLSNGQNELAEECLIKSFNLKPDFQPRGYLPAAGILARSKMRAGDWAGAADILQKLTASGNADSVWFYLYAEALVKQNMTDDAIKVLNRALKKDPKNQFLQSLLSKITSPSIDNQPSDNPPPQNPQSTN